MKKTNSLVTVPGNEAVTSFTSSLAKYNMPFICMVRCASGIEDMENLFHEFGHYNAFYWSAPSTSLNQSNDFDEVFSQAMSLLATNYYDEIYEPMKSHLVQYIPFYHNV